ncbi:MAG: hypothetical protein K5858_09920, partial [Lachnospiraceae bacterium]|nr:hypothetical protein [Lachnospiraceae bacterium]
MSKALKLFVIAVAWLVIGFVLILTVGQKFAPSGGLDALASAIVYVFFWRIIVFVPPVVLSCISLFTWLKGSHPGAIKYVLVGVGAALVFIFLWNTFGKKLTVTPESNAKRIPIYETWLAEEKERNANWGIKGWTEHDYIYEYVKEKVVNDTLSNLKNAHPGEFEELRKTYIDAAMENVMGGISHVTGWEYVRDVETITGGRSDAPDYGYLLNNSELLQIAMRYGRELNRDHWYDRYQFGSSFTNDYSSTYPMMMLFYDDGTMDIVATAPFD